MKIITAISLFMSFALACFAAEDSDKQLPKATETIISELNTARAKAATEAIKKLQKVQGELTKKGDLEGAMATKKYIEGLQKSVADGKGADQSSNAVDPIIGRWGDGSEVRWEFKADGTGNHYWSGAILPYQWTHTDSGYTVVITGRAPRVLTFVDKSTINIEPGNSVRMK